MNLLECARVSSFDWSDTGLIGSKYVWKVCRDSRVLRRSMARVHRSTAAFSAEPSGIRSTGLFTAVDKEPTIRRSPVVDPKKHQCLRARSTGPLHRESFWMSAAVTQRPEAEADPS